MTGLRPMALHEGISTTSQVWNILMASREGDLERVKRLGNVCPALLACQYDYTSPLHFAVREGHTALVRFLIDEVGIDPCCRNHPYLEPLPTLAADRGYADIVNILKQGMADPTSVRTRKDTGKIDFEKDETQRRFQDLVDRGMHEEVEDLLRVYPGLALDEDAFWGEGILAMPAKEGERLMLELLMKYGARVPDVSKWPKEYYFKNYESAVFLLDRGANPNHHTWRGVTVLHDLVFEGRVEFVNLLLDRGADIDAIDGEYYSTPLGYAAHWGHHEMVALLLERGADPVRAGKPWATPMAWARRKGHKEIEALLGRC